MTFLRRLIMILFLCIFFINLANSKNQEGFSRNFWSPMFNGQRVNYCALDGKECGLAIANRYCKILGYEKATVAIREYNVGVTHYLLTRARCRGWRCNGFKLITCAGHFHFTQPPHYYYRSNRFVFPRFNHYRVDWCYKNGQGCGQKAAYSFCRQMGYLRVENYKKEEDVSATKAIGNQKLCFGRACKGFSSITCNR